MAKWICLAALVISQASHCHAINAGWTKIQIRMVAGSWVNSPKQGSHDSMIDGGGPGSR